MRVLSFLLILSFISPIKSSICPSLGLTSIVGSSNPVGRIICSIKLWFVFSSLFYYCKINLIFPALVILELTFKILGFFIDKPFAQDIVFIAHCKVVQCFHQNSSAFGLSDDKKISAFVLCEHNFFVHNFVHVIFGVFVYDKLYPLT